MADSLTVIFTGLGVALSMAGLVWAMARSLVRAIQDQEVAIVELKGELAKSAVSAEGIARLIDERLNDLTHHFEDHEMRLRVLEQRSS